VRTAGGRPCRFALCGYWRDVASPFRNQPPFGGGGAAPLAFFLQRWKPPPRDRASINHSRAPPARLLAHRHGKAP